MYRTNTIINAFKGKCYLSLAQAVILQKLAEEHPHVLTVSYISHCKQIPSSLALACLISLRENDVVINPNEEGADNTWQLNEDSFNLIAEADGVDLIVQENERDWTLNYSKEKVREAVYIMSAPGPGLLLEDEKAILSELSHDYLLYTIENISIVTGLQPTVVKNIVDRLENIGVLDKRHEIEKGYHWTYSEELRETIEQMKYYEEDDDDEPFDKIKSNPVYIINRASSEETPESIDNEFESLIRFNDSKITNSKKSRTMITPLSRMRDKIEPILGNRINIKDYSKEQWSILKTKYRVLDGPDCEAAALALLMLQFETYFTEPLNPAAGSNYAIYDNTSERPQSINFAYLGAKVVDSFNALISKGMADSIVSEGENHDSQVGFILSERFVKDFYGGQTDYIKPGVVSRCLNIYKPEELQKKKLYFTGRVEEKIQMIEQSVLPGNFDRIMKRQLERGRQKALLYLFYGEPGTGKTEESKQLAIQSGRILLIADAAKLQGAWVGESEKAYRAIFRNLRYVTAISKKAPILLFNEADSIIGKRNPDAMRSVDKMENTLLSILLQELENMEGVFIATTNLADGIDPAFISRFIEKIEFPVPSESVRELIWKAQIPKLSRKDLQRVSKFGFCGRSIEHIAQRCDTCEVLTGEIPSISKIIEYCEEEDMIMPRYNNGPRQKIGFSALINTDRNNQGNEY